MTGNHYVGITLLNFTKYRIENVVKIIARCLVTNMDGILVVQGLGTSSLLFHVRATHYFRAKFEAFTASKFNVSFNGIAGVLDKIEKITWS